VGNELNRAFSMEEVQMGKTQEEMLNTYAILCEMIFSF
jgi:hypothetical protein